MALVVAATSAVLWLAQGPGDGIRMCDCGGYALSETPVTRAQWQTVMGGPPPSPGTERWPMTNVSWHEVTNFCFLK